jgi:hypothetical protein
METPKEYYYTYYSYEEWGRGYFGSRGCKCLPEKDVKYFGSSKDKNFKPTQKIILKDDYATREEAYADEIILQQYYKVVENPHFANKAYQTTAKFCISKEKAIEIGRKLGTKYGKEAGAVGGKKGGKLQYENKIGMFSLTFEEKSEIGKKTYELGIGVHGQTREQRINNGRKGVKTQKELCIGIFNFTPEQRQEIGRKVYENGLGVHGLSKEETIENAKKGGLKAKELGLGAHAMTKEEKSQNAKKINSQRWECLETGFISTPGSLTKYQRNRGIDTTKRVRIS